jgi:hypothetical protein
MIAAFMKQMDRNRSDAFDEKTQSNRDLSGAESDRRQSTNQKLSQYGFSPIGSVASNEKDLVGANISEKANITAMLNKMNTQVQGEIDQTNAGMETEPGFGEKLFSGAVKGFNLGSSIYGAVTGNKDLNPGDDTTKNTTTTSGSDSGFNLQDIMNLQRKKKKLNKTGSVSLPEEMAFQY